MAGRGGGLSLPGYLTAMAAITKSYFYAGSGEVLSAKVAGAVATVIAQSDTEIDLSVTQAALTAAENADA